MNARYISWWYSGDGAHNSGGDGRGSVDVDGGDSHDSVGVDCCDGGDG